jgi:hypothetical protein
MEIKKLTVALRKCANASLNKLTQISDPVCRTPVALWDADSDNYEVVSKIFLTEAAKIIKLIIRPIGRLQPQSISVPHVDTGPTIFSIFGTLPLSPVLSECQSFSAIRPGSSQWYQTSVLSASISHLETDRSHGVPNQGEYGGWGLTSIFCFVRNCWVKTEV